MTRSQAEARARELVKGGRKDRHYIAELSHGRTWIVAEYNLDGSRAASTFHS